MKRIVIFLLIVCFGWLVFLPQTSGLAQTLNRSRAKSPVATTFDPYDQCQISFRVFNHKNGLYQTQINCIEFDQQGYLWVGTTDGAARYNGHSWTAVHLPTKTKSNHIKAMLAASDGSMWFGSTNAGLSRLKNGEWKVFTTELGVTSQAITALIETKSESGAATIWVGTAQGCAFYQGEQWTALKPNTGLPSETITSLAELKFLTGKPTVWAGTTSGLAYLDGQTWKPIPNFPLSPPLSTVTAMLETQDETGQLVVWVGTNAGVCRLASDGTWSVFGLKEGLPNLDVTALMKTTEKGGTEVLWAGTNGGGIARFSDGVWRLRNEQIGLPSNAVLCLKVNPREPNHALWIGLNGAGLTSFDFGKWRYIDARNGVPNSNVYSVLTTENSQGATVLWAGTFGNGIGVLDRQGWSRITTENGLADDRVLMLYEAPAKFGSKAIWAGTANGMSRIENGQVTSFGTREGLPHPSVLSFLQTSDPAGEPILWVGTQQGMATLRGKVISLVESLPKTIVTCFTQTETPDGKGIALAGVGSEIAILENNVWGLLPHGTGFPEGIVQSLVVTKRSDGRKILWVGTNSGLAWRELDQVQSAWQVLSETSEPKLPNHNINQVLMDAYSQVYLCTNRGVIRLEPRSSTAFKPADFKITSFTTDDGLPSNDANQNAASFDQKGRLWVGTVDGLAALNPRMEVSTNLKDPLFLEQAKFLRDGKMEKASLLTPGMELRYVENSVFFEFALLSFFRESDCTYQTQLIGLEAEPTVWTTKYIREYPTLPPGWYTFQVWGKDHQGNVSGPVSIAFRVKPPLWQTWWAVGLYVVGLAGFGYTGVRLRVRQLRLRTEQLEREVAKRTTQLEEKNRELDTKNEAISKALTEVESSKREIEAKNKELDRFVTDLKQKNEELIRSKEELIESHRRANRIFSALQEALPGTVLDNKYRLEDKIGAGGFGAVYRGIHLGLQKPIAVKVFQPLAGNASAESLERFRLEGVSACRINHPNAVSVLDSGISENGIAYLVMELLTGHTLTKELQTLGRLSLLRCAQIIVPVCDVLVVAHAAGIIHRDIKPDNIFLHQGPEGEAVKVVDFGIAKLVGNNKEGDIQTLTEAGGIIGTPTYMAPERLTGRPYDGKSDVYSVGVVLYQMLCGRPPFLHDGNLMEVVLAHINHQPPSMRKFVPDLPEAVETVVLKALTKDPGIRISASELATEFVKAFGVDLSHLSKGGGRGIHKTPPTTKTGMPTIEQFSNLPTGISVDEPQTKPLSLDASGSSPTVADTLPRFLAQKPDGFSDAETVAANPGNAETVVDSVKLPDSDDTVTR
ncbi:MAG: protein kinase [Acidobacteria bacterium]|nr:protein kinase [Acidobacteriota bacterium]